MRTAYRLAAVVAAAVVLSPASSASAAELDDAYAWAGENPCTWSMGTAALGKRVELRDGRFLLTSFRNELTGVETVEPDTPSEEFRVQWDGQFLTGATGGWTCVRGSALHVSEGGEPALRVDVELLRGNLGVTKHYLVYPQGSLIREWTEYRNAGAGPHRVGRPSFMAQRLLGSRAESSDLLYMRGGKAEPGSFELEREALSGAYRRTLDSYDRFGCSGGEAGWRDIRTYVPSGYGGRPEWHDADRGWVWPAAQNPGPAGDSARAWRAPRDGTVSISGRVAMQQFLGDGVKITITKNDDVIWGPRRIAANDAMGLEAQLAGLAVTRGDVIRVVIGPGPNGNHYYDDVAWDPTLAYQDGQSVRASQGFSGQQGANDWRYQDGVKANCPKNDWAETSSAYMPWFALWDRERHDGVFVGFDYYGRWAAPIGDQDDAGVSLSLEIPNYDSELAPGRAITSPKAFAGVYAGDLDDMTDRLLDWQYRYMWDYAREPYLGGIRTLADWCPGSQWCRRWDQAGTLQKIFGVAERMRTMGFDVYQRDNGWWDRPGDWNGPNFRLSKEYLAKSGMDQLIYMMAYNANTGSAVYREHPEWWETPSPCSYADWLMDLTSPEAERWMGDLLISKANAWGDYQWRNDSCPVGPWTGARQLSQDQAFRRVQQRFLDERSRSAIMGVDSGGQEVTWEFVRMASSFQFSDRGDVQLAHGASHLFPVVKFGLMPDAWDPSRCDRSYNALLAFTPDFTGDPIDPAPIACMRRLLDRYHFLENVGLNGRWVRQYHPDATDADRNWFERLSRDRARALIVYTGGGSGGPVVVYPKGLDSDGSYDVRFEIAGGVIRRTGRELMRTGVSLPSIAAGELVWLNVPNHPGAGTDATAPTAPARVRAAAGTNMGWSGVDVSWEPAHDDNWISAYEVLRDGEVIATVATGAFWFDHTPGASPAAQYAVRTVDGDGNRSPAAAAPRDPTARVTGVDDAEGAVSFQGVWLHATNTPGAFKGTIAISDGSCQTACQGFGSVQGVSGWRYQDRVDGQWRDVQTYRSSGYLGMAEWHDDVPRGYVWPRAIHPGPANETARTWTARRPGSIDITGHVTRMNGIGNGVVVSITRNDETIWAPHTLDGDDAAGVDANVENVAVNAGDAIRFVIENNHDWRYDATWWDPELRNASCRAACQGFGSVQGVSGWRYQDRVDGQWRDIQTYRSSGYLGMAEWHDDVPRGYVWPRGMHPGPANDTSRTWTAPRAGSIDITGHVTRMNGNGNGVVVQITKNGQTIWGPRTLAGDDLVGFGASVGNVAVNAGDAIRFEIGNNGDWLYDATWWDPDLRYADTATYDFDGSGITWFAKLGPDAGIAAVSIDGKPEARIDLFAPDANNWSIPVFSKALDPGHHTITIAGTRERNPKSNGTGVSVDGFRVLGDAPQVVEEDGPGVRFAGGGWARQPDAAASGGWVRASARPGDSVEIAFRGRRFAWIGRHCGGCGEAEVYVDGEYAGRVDTYGYRGPETQRTPVFERSFPSDDDPHTVRIVVTGTRNLDATGANVAIDAFEVRP